MDFMSLFNSFGGGGANIPAYFKNENPMQALLNQMTPGGGYGPNGANPPMPGVNPGAGGGYGQGVGAPNGAATSTPPTGFSSMTDPRNMMILQALMKQSQPQAQLAPGGGMPPAPMGGGMQQPQQPQMMMSNAPQFQRRGYLGFGG